MPSSDKTAFDSQQNAREYYGQELSTTADLKTTACCTTEAYNRLDPAAGDSGCGC